MIDAAPVLTGDQRASFEATGYLALRGALNVERDVAPLQRELDHLIRLAAHARGVTLRADARDFDARFLDLVAQWPEAGAVIYDAAKNLPEFIRLTVHPTIEQIARDLRSSDFVGSAAHGQGIRMDRPGETRHLLPWHQDFPFQLRSADGIVFWIPLVSITPDMGPVELCVGSHRLGAQPLEARGDAPDEAVQAGVYENLRIRDEDALVSKFEQVSVIVEPGDVLLFDFLSIHRSGRNVSGRTRWTAQIRYFNFLEEFGRENGWSGSFKSGKTLRQINESLSKVRRFRDGG